MSKIQELAFTLNLSAGIPGMNIQSKTADKFDEYAKDLYDYTLNNLKRCVPTTHLMQYIIA